MPIAEVAGSGMKRETALLNIICVVAAVGFVALAVLNALFSGDFLTTDNLFLTLVCLVLALMFAVNPLLYLKSEGKLPVPFKRRASDKTLQPAGAGTGSLPSGRANGPPLLDTKGRPVPPDVKSIVDRFTQPSQKDL